MVDLAKIQKGMQVFGDNNQLIGKVERISGQDIYIRGKRFSLSSFSRLERNRLYMSSGSQQADSALQQDTGTIKVPVVEEQLNVGKRQVEFGEVELQKTVTQQQVNVPVELRREEVQVREVDINDRPITASEANAVFQESTIQIPVRGEEAVASKQTVVTGEVVVNKDVTTEQQQISDTIRKEQVTVDNNVTQSGPSIQTPPVSRNVETAATKETQGVDQTNVTTAGNDAYLSTSNSERATAGTNSFEQAQVEDDMEVYSSDNHHVGKVKEVTDSYFLVGRGLFKGSIEASYNSVQKVEGDNIILNLTKNQVDALT